MLRRHLISIRNIPWTVSNSQLEEYFSMYGDVRNAKIIFDKYGLSTGYGFVEFYDKIVANSVLHAHHVLDNEKVLVTKGLKYLHEYPVKQFVKKYVLDADTCNK